MNGNISNGVLLLALGTMMILNHRAVLSILMKVSRAAREAHHEPWPWWRWPRPTDRGITALSWILPAIWLGLGVGVTFLVVAFVR